MIRSGCGVWSNRQWVGRIFAPNTPADGYLRQYATTFSAVEGNTYFFGLPRPERVHKWKKSVPESFRFCFKVPREITHIKRLVDAETELSQFLERMAPLSDNLGPFFLQFPRSFGPLYADILYAFISHLPLEFAFAVELRHPDFLGSAEYAKRIVDREVSMVITDTRPHVAKNPQSPERTPSYMGKNPIIRYIGLEDIKKNAPFLSQWASVCEHWLSVGCSPYFFAHTDTDEHAPEIARGLHLLCPSSPPAPCWISEGGQLELF